MDQSPSQTSIILALFLAAAALIECNQQAAGRRAGFQSPCGTATEVAARVGRCMDPIFELVEGKFDEPKSDRDIMNFCQKYNGTEKCIRNISRDCLSGIHKTSVSSIAAASKRFRTAECKNEQTRSKYLEPLKCSRIVGKTLSQLYRNYTSMMQTIRDLPIAPEQKLVKICCMLDALDRDVAKIYDGVCPASTPAVSAILRAMVDDARTTLCINPKCKGAIEGIKPTNLKENQNFLEPTMQILFQLSDS